MKIDRQKQIKKLKHNIAQLMVTLEYLTLELDILECMIEVEVGPSEQ